MTTTADRIGVDPHAALLGEIVTWDMASLEVPFSRVIAALGAAGLPVGEAAALRSTTAFTRAVKDLREGRTIDRVTRDKTTGLITLQFTRKHLDASGLQLDFDYEALAHLNTDSGHITCPDSSVIEDHARLMFRHALDHRTTSDVTRLVQRLFSTHADLYPINPRKGVAYFVPEAHREFSARVEQFLEALGGRLLRFPIPTGTPEGNRAVKASVEDGLTSLANELSSAVDAWDEKTRETTFTKAIERWQVLKHKAEAYSEYLGDRQAALLAHLDAQKKRLAEKIAQLTAARDAAAHGDGEGQRTLFPGAASPIATDVDEPEPATA